MATKKRLCFGAFLFFLILGGLFYCTFSSQGSFNFDNVKKEPSLTRFKIDYTSEIEIAKLFSEQFIKSYLAFLEKEINPKLRDSFVLRSKTGISVRLILSTVVESCILIYPSDRSELIVDCSKYPVQFFLASGIETVGSNTKLPSSYEETISAYGEAGVPFELPDKGSYFLSKITISSTYPKFFRFADNSCAFLHNVDLVVRGNNGHKRTLSCEPVCFITGDADFAFFLKKAPELGKQIAIMETIDLFVSSPFFKELLAYDELKPDVEAILQKKSRAEKDPSFKYEFPFFKKDKQDLILKAKQLGLDTSFVDGIFEDPALQPSDGYLLWYYKSHSDFMLQWVIVNILLLVLMIIVHIIKKRGLLRGNYYTNIVVSSVIIIGINGWIFKDRKPDSYHFQYMLLPGALFLICLLLSLKLRNDDGQRSETGNE